MKLPAWSIFFVACLVLPARADLTIVQKVEAGGSSTDMTVKVKGTKARIEATPEETTIFDGSTGEMITLMNTQKTVVRVSAEKMKAAAEMMNKFSREEKTAEKPKLTATGKKDKINGYDVDEYVYDAPDFKASYWVALKYPDGAAILKEMKALKMDAWTTSSGKVPDYTDFPGLPIKTVVSANGKEITSTIVSIKRDPLGDSEFSIPKDFHEIKTPAISPVPENEKTPATEPSPGG